MDIETHNLKKDQVLVIAFGGLALALDITPYEFKTILTTNFDCGFIFVRDVKRAWYHMGVVGAGDNPEEVAKTLRSLYEQFTPRKVITLGTSAGGFGAILFGQLLGADNILAFGPQTCLPVKEFTGTDHRFLSTIRKIPKINDDYIDLLSLPNKAKQINIVYGTDTHPDVFHAERMNHLPNVKLHPMRGGHAIVSHMKRTGQLLEMLKEVVA